ncbi:unnamed protein product [[Candida] boidinii]|uniref:Ubiquitin carboxyl-terminal hydrolase n=1 Tax=Candida boidinii TaxID=5477 RepID=A0A9W6STR8_CANBO|nr:unnamed protein product [[Candida] boidinii]
MSTIIEYINSIDLTELTSPSKSTPVYKDDCMFSFETALGDNGIDICMSCYQAFSRDGLNYTQQHSEFLDHKLYLNYRKTLKPKSEAGKYDSEDGSEQPLKFAKLEVKDEIESDLFDIKTAIYCSEINKSIEFPSNEQIPAKLRQVAESILSSTSNEKREEIKAWEQEIVPCHHCFDIIQTPVDNLNLKKCSHCELEENLWICVVCGSLGCGRSQFGGVPGNSHALQHNSDNNEHHIAVKLGSLSSDSADCYCYTCNDEVTVPNLKDLLLTYNIDISHHTKTEKNLTELQIEQNVKWDFNMDGNNGEILTPIFGKGLTGMKNLGNSCYLSSVIQVLYSIPEFADCFYIPEGMPVEKILNPDPATDLETQLFKLGDGLLSGRYSVPDKFTTEQLKYQRGIKPSGFKSLIGKDHPEFSTMQQQDAFEFWIYLLDIIEKKKITGVSEKSPTDLFKFVLEDKLKCTNCNKVRITRNVSENVCLPIDSVVLSVDKDSGKKTYGPISFKDSFQNWLAPEEIEYNCPQCKSKQTVIKKNGFKSYPEYLVLSPQRIKLENWVPVKMEVPIDFDGSLNLNFAKSQGKLDSEEELPESEEDENEIPSQEYQFNQDAMNDLFGMGFPENRCKRALYATGNSASSAAMEWLFAHMEDSDIDDPFVISDSTSVISKKYKDEDVEALMNMGFEKAISVKALVLNKGNIEAAIEWVFSHPDDDGILPEDNEDGDNDKEDNKIEAMIEKNGSNGNYELLGVICHKGTSIHSGHYVAFIKKDTGNSKVWVLFNDEKVVPAESSESFDEIKTSGYVYVYKRKN